MVQRACLLLESNAPEINLLSSLLHVQVRRPCDLFSPRVLARPTASPARPTPKHSFDTWQDRLVRAEIYETRLKASSPAERARFAEAVETTKLQLERAV